jgi:NAD(P)-dependent dehydrogenase (short-subunit alcohol dehydrogenase family)
MGVLQDKAVVITGAGRGLGRAYALAAANAGASVLVNDVDGDVAKSVVDDIRAAGGSSTWSNHDVGEAADAAALIDQCVSEYGKLDGLVNNAGLFHICPPWLEEGDRVERLIRVNVIGSIHVGLAAIKVMRTAGTGSIVNVTSGAHLGMPEMSTYGASKGAVTSMTFAWSLDLKDSGVRVNAISPIAKTRMSDVAGVTRPQPTPTSIAPLCVYLLSDASGGLSGQVLRLDGERLSVLSPASFEQSAPPAGQWDVPSIAAAFDRGELALQPVGLARMRLAP